MWFSQDKFVSPLKLTCPGHTRPVVKLMYSNIAGKGQVYLISACLDGKAMLRDGTTGDWLGTFVGHKGAVWSAAITNDGKRALSGSADYEAKFWSCETGKELASFSHPKMVKEVSFSLDEKSMVTGCFDKKIRVWDLTSSTSPLSTIEGSDTQVRNAFYLDPNTLISDGSKEGIQIWDLRSNNRVNLVKTSEEVSSISLARAGQAIVATYGKTVSFYDPSTWSPIHSHKVAQNIETASLHPTLGRFIMGGRDDNWVHVVDYETGEVLETHKGHHGPVHWVKFSPTGDSYSSGSDDGTVRIWQTFPPLP